MSGSFHVIDFDGDLIILDAGIFYGGDEAGAPELPADLPREAKALILSHAHLDHAGRLMGLVKSGYRGPIYCSLPSRELLPTMLAMSASSGDFGRESFFYSKNSYRNNRRERKDTCVHLHDDCPWGEKIKEKRTFRGSRNDLEKNGFYLCKDCAAMEVEEVLEQVRVVYPGRKYHVTPPSRS